jgi:hypothetical protein
MISKCGPPTDNLEFRAIGSVPIALIMPPSPKLRCRRRQRTLKQTPFGRRCCLALLRRTDRALLVDYLAYNPTAGDLIHGMGGVRKLRRGLGGRGKRGGARVIYFHHDAERPLFALIAFAKK